MNISRSLRAKLKMRFPKLWGRLHVLKGSLIVRLQKRLIRKGKTIYLGASDQDRWIVEDVYRHKREGYFVELGAYDGVRISNTYVLEKVYGWKGICIEPDPSAFSILCKERDCICVQACIDGFSHEVNYLYRGALGGIVAKDTDIHPKLVRDGDGIGRVDSVKTRTLYEILREYNAPRIIDFLSLDVEGSETRILRNFPFEKYVFRALVIERTSPELNQILRLHGYQFIELRVGDSFYLHQSFPGIEKIPKQPFAQVPPKPARLPRNFCKKELTLRLAISAFV